MWYDIYNLINIKQIADRRRTRRAGRTSALLLAGLVPEAKGSIPSVASSRAEASSTSQRGIIKMPIHKGPPPGYSTIEQVCDPLDMSRQNFYQSGLNDVIDSWQTKPNTPRLYKNQDVGMLKWWLFTRRGLIALSLLPGNAPLKPAFDLESTFQEGHHNSQCPQCDKPGIADWETERVWCPDCGIIP